MAGDINSGVADAPTQITVTFSSAVVHSSVESQGDWTVVPVPSVGVEVSVLSAVVQANEVDVVLTLYPRLSAGIDYLVTSVNSQLVAILLTNQSGTLLTNQSGTQLTTG